MARTFNPIELPDVPEEVLHQIYKKKRDELYHFQEHYQRHLTWSIVLGFLLPCACFPTIYFSDKIQLFPFIMIISALVSISIFWLSSFLCCYKLTIKQLRIDVYRKQLIERVPKITEKIREKNQNEWGTSISWYQIPQFSPLAKSIGLSAIVCLPLFLTTMLFLDLIDRSDLDPLFWVGILIACVWGFIVVLAAHRTFIGHLKKRVSRAKKR